MEKILLVEDDLQIVKHLNSYLRENGYHLIAVDGQKKAMQILQQQSIDLILLDKISLFTNLAGISPESSPKGFVTYSKSEELITLLNKS